MHEQAEVERWLPVACSRVLRYLGSVLVSVQKTRRGACGDLIATILDGRGGTEDLCLDPKDAAEVERVWALSQFDLDRYANLPPNFPRPDSIPVEISGPA